MPISDPGVPSDSGWYAIKQLLLNNVVSPNPAGWPVAINETWLKHKLQKQYQICIVPLYSEDHAFNLTGGTSTTRPTIATAYYQITLVHPDRASAHGLFRNVMAVLNNETLTVPQAAGAYTGVAGTNYHWVKVTKSSMGQMIDIMAPDCGPGGKDETCTGYRYDITVALRWNE
jgi:hypothetical protein